MNERPRRVGPHNPSQEEREAEVRRQMALGRRRSERIQAEGERLINTYGSELYDLAEGIFWLAQHPSRDRAFLHLENRSQSTSQIFRRFSEALVHALQERPVDEQSSWLTGFLQEMHYHTNRKEPFDDTRK